MHCGCVLLRWQNSSLWIDRTVEHGLALPSCQHPARWSCANTLRSWSLGQWKHLFYWNSRLHAIQKGRNVADSQEGAAPSPLACLCDIGLLICMYIASFPSHVSSFLKWRTLEALGAAKSQAMGAQTGLLLSWVQGFRSETLVKERLWEIELPFLSLCCRYRWWN